MFRINENYIYYDDKFYYLRNESSYHRNLRILCVVLTTSILNRDSMSRRGYKLVIIIELPLTNFFFRTIFSSVCRILFIVVLFVRDKLHGCHAIYGQGTFTELIDYVDSVITTQLGSFINHFSTLATVNLMNILEERTSQLALVYILRGHFASCTRKHLCDFTRDISRSRKQHSQLGCYNKNQRQNTWAISAVWK